MTKMDKLGRLQALENAVHSLSRLQSMQRNLTPGDAEDLQLALDREVSTARRKLNEARNKIQEVL